ncbi:GNAT family N-acetyltransferase [Pseudomonas citronellolis]|uniref:GNAT family N-acetyltransferase n=1 Tax=Pseudomonas citronellolis TaxID=53408 RepID=UPI0012FE7C5F|nr:GNAT family N-acetyltransferase [Pseudomonas citronellolis]
MKDKETDYALLKVSLEADWQAYHDIRRRVLWEERGKYNYNSNLPDEYAISNHPLLLKLAGRPIGTTRLDDYGRGRGIVRLVAISLSDQRQGHGRILSELVEDYARRLFLEVLLVNAAPDAVGFYKKMSWQTQVWDNAEYMSGKSDCVQMVKSLVD